jgi:hypothetical protein
MMKRRLFTTLPFLGLGCASMSEKAEGAGGFVVDDAIPDVRPKLLLNYSLGSPTFRFKATFDSLSLQKEVLLAEGASVKVNGIRLQQGSPDLKGVYAENIKFSEVIVIEIIRPGTLTQVFELSIPIFKVVNYPKLYKYPEDLTLLLMTPLKAKDIKSVEDRFSGTIYRGLSTAFPFTEKSLPTSEMPALVMKPIFSNSSGSFKNAKLELQRLQRVALREVTTAYPQGWIVMTVADQFLIDVAA